jgi:protein-S-isoprenylcysteine O-methyltransferase Ste14
MALTFIALIALAATRRRDESGAQETQSRLGIALQGIGLAIVWIGQANATLPWANLPAISEFGTVFLLMAGVLGLFAASPAALGKNWSIKARTLSDHELIRRGPYAYVRHPIYLAMLLFLLAMTVALGHWLHLIVALPVFLIGTTMRITAEDRLLQESFGEDFVGYRNSTPALFLKIR